MGGKVDEQAEVDIGHVQAFNQGQEREQEKGDLYFADNIPRPIATPSSLHPVKGRRDEVFSKSMKGRCKKVFETCATTANVSFRHDPKPFMIGSQYRQ